MFRSEVGWREDECKRNETNYELLITARFILWDDGQAAAKKKLKIRLFSSSYHIIATILRFRSLFVGYFCKNQFPIIDGEVQYKSPAKVHLLLYFPIIDGEVQ